jgi:hypothetical protein
MNIQITLIAHCCNSGATYGYQLQAALEAEGHTVTFQSRNSHGRDARQMRLEMYFDPERLKDEPLLLVQWEDGRVLYFPAKEWGQITKKEESDAPA